MIYAPPPSPEPRLRLVSVPSRLVSVSRFKGFNMESSSRAAQSSHSPLPRHLPFFCSVTLLFVSVDAFRFFLPTVHVSSRPRRMCTYISSPQRGLPLRSQPVLTYSFRL